MRIGVVTVSDRCFAGTAADGSGPLISSLLSDLAETAEYVVVPDERPAIEAALIRLCDVVGADAVFTTGGTGLAPRDVTPEATRAVLDKEVPGIAEAIRAESLRHTPRAMLSRAVAGVRGKTLIVNLPGSPKAVEETVAVVRPVLAHAIETLSGRTLSCGRS